jgi:O-antigen/teichoic acid export membrane protein
LNNDSQEPRTGGTTVAVDPQPPLGPMPPDVLDSKHAGGLAIRGSVLRVGGYFVGMLLSILGVSLLYRHLQAANYGHYVVVIALVTTVQGITDIGLGQIGVREFATRHGSDRERLMRNLLGVRIVLTTVGIGGAVAFAAVAGYGGQLVVGTLLAGVGMLLAVIQGTFMVPLAAQLRLGWATAMDLLRQILTVMLIVALVVVGAKVLSFLAVTVPVGIVVLATNLTLVRRSMPLRPSFEREEWLSLMRAVLPFAAANAIGTLYLRSTIILMPLLANKHQTGYYALSYNILAVVLALPALTVGNALPILARAARDDAERLSYVLGRLFEVMLIVGVWIALGLGLGAGFAVLVLSGGHSHTSIVVLEIQSLAVITQFVTGAWGYGLLALRMYRPLPWIAAGSLTVNVLLTVILVPLLKARGAAISFTSAELVGTAASLAVLVHRRPELMPSLRVPARVLVAGAAGAAVAFVPGLTSLERCAIGSTVYVAMILALRAIPPEMLQAFLHRPRATNSG